MWFQKLVESFHDTSCLVYPHLCLNCQAELHQRQELLCLRCLATLPYTSFHKNPKNNLLHLLSQAFFKFEYMTALFFFQKQNPIQLLLHKLKYEKQEYIGQILGQWYTNELSTEVPFWKELDLMTVVPLSPEKERQRGYNQNSLFAQTLSQNLDVPLDESLLIGKPKQQSQTHLDRLDRWQNIKNAYEAQPNKNLNSKHILIVDDVFTTGVTLEICAKALAESYEVKISVLTIAATPKL